jgi:hypothetical protein
MRKYTLRGAGIMAVTAFSFLILNMIIARPLIISFSSYSM